MLRRRRLRLAGAGGASVVAVVLGAGCSGARPSLPQEGTEATVLVGGATGSATGIPGADAILARLERAGTGTFTARYDVLRKFGGVASEATVVSHPPDRAVTIGDVRLIGHGGDGGQTCVLSTAACEDGLREQAISDSGVTSTFYGESAARSLRVALARRSGDVTTSQRTVLGGPVDCVMVPLAGPTNAGEEVYCASDLGPLAYWDSADKTVELSYLEPTAQLASLLPPNP